MNRPIKILSRKWWFSAKLVLVVIHNKKTG